MTEQLKAPPHGLSVQFVTAESTWIDWRELYQNGDEYDVLIPPATYGTVKEQAESLFDEWVEAAREEAEADDSAFDPATAFDLEAELTEEHADEWQQSDRFDEWKDQFYPMMNYAWPVSLAYGGPGAAEAARLIDQFAGACCLVEFGEGHNPFGPEFASDTPEYGIALTGGGMDLSDHLAVAYLCCGCVPPERLLSGLDGFSGPARSGRLGQSADLLRQAYSQAVDYFRHRADRLEEVAGRLELAEEVA